MTYQLVLTGIEGQIVSCQTCSDLSVIYCYSLVNMTHPSDTYPVQSYVWLSVFSAYPIG